MIKLNWTNGVIIVLGLVLFAFGLEHEYPSSGTHPLIVAAAVLVLYLGLWRFLTWLLNPNNTFPRRKG